MKNLAAFTPAINMQNPPYVSISQGDDGQVVISVRSVAHKHGHAGVLATIAMSASEFRALLTQIVLRSAGIESIAK